MSATVELVSLGIQAAIRLARSGRAVYVEATIDRALVIPLPSTFSGFDTSDEAFRYAQNLRRKDSKAFNRHYRDDFKAASNGETEEARARARQRLTDTYLVQVASGLIAIGGTQKPRPGDVGLLALRQYGEDRPFPHPLQRIAGTLAEIAVDYYLYVPGAIDKDTTTGKALTTLLEGLDEFNFQETSWDGIVVMLFKVGLDTLAAHPDFISGSEDRREALKQVLSGVSRSLTEHLEQMQKDHPEGDLDALERLARAGEVAARSLLRNTATVFVENPAFVGITHSADQAVFSKVGAAFVDILLGDTGDGGEYSFKDAADRLLSSRGLDKLILSFLEATSKNPEFFRVSDDDLRGYIGNILEDLFEGHKQGTTFFDPDIFLEVASAIFENGIRDLPLLLHITEDQRAVTVEVARLVYDLITEVKGGKGKLELQLVRPDVISLFQRTLDVVTSSEAWIANIDRNTNDAAHALAILRLSLGLLLDDSPSGLPTTLANGRFDLVLQSLLSSGLAAALLELSDSKKLTQIKDLLIASLAEDGLAGLSRVWEDGRLIDLMSALAQSPTTLQKFVGGGAGSAQAIASAVNLVRSIRQGATPSVPEMIELLEGGEES